MQDEKIEQSQDRMDPKVQGFTEGVFLSLFIVLCWGLSFWMRSELSKGGMTLRDQSQDGWQGWVLFGYECSTSGIGAVTLVGLGVFICSVLLLVKKGNSAWGAGLTLGGLLDMVWQHWWDGCVASYVSYPVLGLERLIGIHTLLITGGVIVLMYTVYLGFQSQQRREKNEADG